MKLFHSKNNKRQAENVRQFERLMAMNSDIKFFQPRPDVAPWHVQAEVNGFLMNFWPHLLKANFDGEKSVTGYDNIQRLVGEARNAPDDEELVEDEE